MSYLTNDFQTKMQDVKMKENLKNIKIILKQKRV